MKDNIPILLNFVQTLSIIIAAIWAITRFRIELPNKPRIELDLDASFLGPQEGNFICSFYIKVRNKGSVNHTISNLEFEVLGIQKNTQLEKNQDLLNRTEFPKIIVKEKNMISPKYTSYFIRPNVEQVIHYYTNIPDNIRFIRVFAAFTYEKSKDKHTTERIFEVSTLIKKVQDLRGQATLLN